MLTPVYSQIYVVSARLVASLATNAAPASAPSAPTDDSARLWHMLISPLLNAEWTAWREFWLRYVFDDRFLVMYAIPLLLPLILLRGDQFRRAAIVASLLFLAYVFGLLYVALWIILAFSFYFLAEKFATESKRTDVKPWGPPLGAAIVITATFFGIWGLALIKLPQEQYDFIYANLGWLYPLGQRPFEWEPRFPGPWENRWPAPFFLAVFWNPHNIGTAYFTVRMLHYFSEIRRGGIPAESRSLLRFVSYVTYAPLLMQGPIERYLPFQEQIERAPTQRSLRDASYGIWRIGWGLAKNLISTLYLTPILIDVYGFGWGAGNRYYLGPESFESGWILYFGVFLQIFTLYLEFSGYCDVAIGISRILGLRIVENFNWPWLATSLRDFWRRWHISLSLILRDYVYIALGGNRTRTTFNLVVTFVLCGLWHVPLWNMGAWGVLMGGMLAINQWWVGWMKTIDARPETRLHRVRHAWLRLWPLPQIVAWIVTMNAFVLSLLLFFGGLGGVRVAVELVKRVARVF